MNKLGKKIYAGLLTLVMIVTSITLMNGSVLTVSAEPGDPEIGDEGTGNPGDPNVPEEPGEPGDPEEPEEPEGEGGPGPATPTNVSTGFYIIKPTIGQLPGVGNSLTPEKILDLVIVSQSQSNYFGIGDGTFADTFDSTTYKSYAEDYRADGYEAGSEYTKVDSIVAAPGLPTSYDDQGYRYTLSGVNWYVIKNEKDGWHVDGIGSWSEGQLIDYTISYKLFIQDYATFDHVDPLNVTMGVIDLKTPADFEAALVERNAEFNLDDYYFAGWYSRYDCVGATKTSLDASKTYSSQRLFGKLKKKADLALTVAPSSTIYTGMAQNYTTTEYAGLPEGMTIEGLTTTVTATDAGSYTTVTTGTPVIYLNGVDVTEQYKLAVTEATYTINRAVVTINVNSATKVQGEADPGFTGTTSCNSSFDYGNVWYDRMPADLGKETAGDSITIRARYGVNGNVDYVVNNGTLTITAPAVIEEEPTPTTPEVPETPEEPVEAPAEEPVQIEDEETPTSDAVDEGTDNTVEIEEEETALAANLRDGDCWIHWLILLLTLVYGVYGVARGIARSNRIKELEGETKVQTN